MTTQATIDAAAKCLLLAMPGARVTFGKNVLYCSHHRTFEENARAALAALAMVTGLSVEELPETGMLTIEMYRSH